MYLCILSCFYIIIKLFWHIIFISFAGPSAAQQGGIFTVTEKKPPETIFSRFRRALLFFICVFTELL